MEKKKVVLLVDDDPDYLFQIKMYVEKMGFEVHSCTGQKEAEEYLAGSRPDLCLFDLMMENDDSGFILCYKAKRLYPDLPVIIATAVASETGMSFESFVEGGSQSWIKADKYLEKGLRADQLHREIEKLLKL